jgi:hypothetical protein
VPESGSLYFTNARAIGSTLTGYTSGSGVVAATDTILQAIQKLNGNVSGLVTGVSSVFGRTGAVIAASGDYNTSQVTENTNLYYTEARVSANTDVAANTAARHAAVTIGTANGLSLSTQALSLGLASGSATGALSSTDWNTFNNKLSTATAASTYVPYTGATGNVTLGTNSLTAGVGSFASSGGSDTFTINHSSGSGIALNITKGGNGEGLYINKTSGTGNAATIIGTLNATTLVKSGGTSSQFLKADGSVDSSTYLTTSAASSTYLPLAGGTLTGALSGTSATFSGTSGAFIGVTINNTDATGSSRLRVTSTGGNVTDMISYSASHATRANQAWIGGDGNSTITILQAGGVEFLRGISTGATIFSSSIAATTATFSGKISSNTSSTIFSNFGGTSIGTTAGNYTGISLGYSENTSYTKTAIVQEQINDGAARGHLHFLVDTANDGNNATLADSKFMINGLTGAATFSSSVTAGGDIYIPNGNYYYAKRNTGGANINVLGFASGTDTLTIKGGTSGSTNSINFEDTGGFIATFYNGRLGIGTSSPTSKLTIQRSGGDFGIGNGIGFKDQAGTTVAGIGVEGANTNDMQIMGSVGIRFYTNSDLSSTNERIRITSGGFIKASNTGTYLGATGSYHEFNSNVAGTAALVIRNTNAAPAGPDIYFTASPNNTTSAFLYCADGTEGKFVVWSNGDVDSRTNSYGGWSDIKLKENITDATPKLQDLLKVKIKNYNFIGDDKKQIGVVAQELEEIFPALVSESPDFETDQETGERIDLGTTTKSVKYSVFVPMLIKAIQEQQAQIEELKAKILSL